MSRQSPLQAARERRPHRALRSRRAQRMVATAAVVALSAGAAFATAPAGAGSDINGDGFDDLVVGVPDEQVSQVDAAGSVNLVRGSSTGITARRDQLITQADIGGTVEAGDRFGNAIAYGDFDGDGFDDVAVGAPTEAHRGKVLAGVVHVIHGSPGGADTSDTKLLSQAGKMAGRNENRDFFGAVLAVGNINGDDYDDLVIGIPGENVGGAISAGAIVVAYGSSSGLRNAGSQFLSPKGKVPGKAEDFDAFGAALAVGDFDNDGFDDVAVGVPGESFGGHEAAGKVTLLSGRPWGLNKRGRNISQSGLASEGDEAGDGFGESLTAGDFNNDGFIDLAVGVPGEDLGSRTDAGAVVVFDGGGAGLSTASARQLTQASSNPDDRGELFGEVLASGDFNNDGFDDLAAGAPEADLGGLTGAGRVAVIPGGGSGLDTGSTLSISQDSMPGNSPQSNDHLGASLRAGDFNGDQIADLAIAAPLEDVGTKIDSGLVHIVHGSNSGLLVGSADKLHQGTKNVDGRPETDDKFGTGL